MHLVFEGFFVFRSIWWVQWKKSKSMSSFCAAENKTMKIVVQI